MDEDIDLVVDCLKHHDVNDSDALRDSLLTIASLCTGSDAAQNKFREGGGLGYALNLLTSVGDDNLKGAVLYTLGCATDSNVYTQRRLCSDALFKFLQCQITSPRASPKLKSSAAFFLSCLVTNNSVGQNLIRSSGCLDSLLSTLSMLLDDAGSLRELWMGIIKTLCSCVNNPRNGENQLLCGTIFPRVLRKLEQSVEPAVIQLTSYFMSLTVEDSESNQERLGIIGGLEVITSALQSTVEALLRRPNQQVMIALSRLVTTLGIASSDHERNCNTLTELQTVPLLVQILSLDVVTTEVKLKVVLTMSSVTQSSEMAQKQLVNSDGLVLLVQTLLENQNDEEMCKAITSVMDSCIKWGAENQNDEEMCYSITSDGVMHQMGAIPIRRHSSHCVMPSMERCTGCRRGPQYSLPFVRVSALGAENLLYSNTLGILSGVTPYSNQKPKPPLSSGGPNFLLDRLKQSLKGGSTGHNLSSFPREEEMGDYFRPDRMIRDGAASSKSLKRDILGRPVRKNLFSKAQMNMMAQKAPEEPVSEKHSIPGMGTAEALEVVEDSCQTPEEPSAPTNDTKPMSYGYGYIQQKLGNLEAKFDKVLKYLNSFRSKEQGSTTQRVLSNDLQLTDEAANRAGRLEENHLEPVASGDADAENIQGQTEMTADVHQRSTEDGPLAVQKDSRNVTGGQTANVKCASAAVPFDVSCRNCKVDKSIVSKLGVGSDGQNKTSVQESARKLPTGRESGRDDTIVQKYQLIQDRDVNKFLNLENGELRVDCGIVSEKQEVPEVYCKNCNKKCENEGNGGSKEVCHGQKGPLNTTGKPSKEGPFPQSDERGKGGEDKVEVVLAEEAAVHGYAGGDAGTLDMEVDDDDVISNWEDPADQSFKMKQKRGEKVTGLQRNADRNGVKNIQGCWTTGNGHSIKCPGCNPNALLNSQTFIKTLMSSIHTCGSHKALASKVRAQYKARIERLVHKSDNTDLRRGDIYSFSEDERKRSLEDDDSPVVPQRLMNRNMDKKRRQRQDFSQEEICNLIKGVRHHGKHWNAILWSYRFKNGRTGVDLMDKYKRLVKEHSCTPSSP